MSAHKSSTIIPQYMRDFSCIGSACEDSCCSGWKVTIDEDTYKKYNRVRDKDLTFTLKKKVTRNRSNPSKYNFAKINMDNNGGCPFLDPEKLCSIQKKLGEEYLSNTCATYPRTDHIINNIYEQSATVSCPEIARLALLNPNGIEFDEVNHWGNRRNVDLANLDTGDSKIQNHPKKYIWELRIFTISLLQNRTYSLNDRLIILGMFYQKIQSLIENKDVHSIPSTIATFTNIIDEGSLRENLNAIPVQLNLQMEIVKAITDQRFFKGINNQRFKQVYIEALAGIGYIKDKIYSEIIAQYEEMYTQYYEPFISEHEYILENYLVNYVFKNMFPFSKYSDVYEEFVMLTVHYAVIKLLFIGVGATHKGMTPDLAVRIIQSFSKTYEHNNQFLTAISGKLKEHEYTSLAYMSILIRN